MDITTILGLASGMVFIVLSMLIGTSFDFAKMINAFVDAASVMITIGGTLAAVLIANPLSKVLSGLKGVKTVFLPPSLDPSKAIAQIISLSNLARKEGVLALEEASNNMEDAFLKKGVMLIVDATDPELVRNILETEMAYIEGRHSAARGVWEFIGSAGPAWGMIGTLIGLVLMLQDMSDPSMIGPQMAIALITTFYGSIMANFIAIPIANKLKIYSADEMLLKEVLVEGLLSIQAGENPRIIEEKLKAFLSPTLRAVSGDSVKPQAGEA